YAVTINPLVNWIWIGFGVLAFGTGIALLPERAFAFAGVRVADGAVTTTLVLLMLLLPRVARARTADRASMRMQLEGETMCTCGACRAPMKDCPMRPGGHDHREQGAKMDKFLEQGMTHDQIPAAFVADHGGEDILAAPRDRGFNRLAWAFPYIAGVAAAGAPGLLPPRRCAPEEQWTAGPGGRGTPPP